MVLALPAGWVAALIAIVLLSVLVATEKIWVPALTWELEQLPVIGGYVAGVVRDGAANAVQWALNWAQSALGDLISIVATPIAMLGGFINDLVTTVAGAVVNIVALVGDVAAHLAWAISQFGALWSKVLSVAAGLASLIAALPGTIAAEAGKLVKGAEQALTAAIAAAVAIVAAAVHAETGARVAGDQALGQAVAQTATDANKALSVAVAGVRAEIGTEIKPVAAEVAHLATDVVPAVAATAAAATAVIATEIATLRTECIDPMCSVMTPQLGTLNLLLDVATLAAVGALVGEAIRDPSGAAAEAAGFMAGVEGVARDLASAFAGVQL